jgi:hypothetical protein
MSGIAMTGSSSAGASSTVVATATTQVTVKSLTDVTVWGIQFSQCPILVAVTPSGTYAPQGEGGPVTFGAQMQFGPNSLNTQPSVFTQAIP